MKNKKILLIVEGEETEPRILGSASHGLLSLIGADYEIVAFSNPIYELYDSYKKEEYDDIVSYLRYEKKLLIDPNILSKNAFSAIYLVFDYEPHYHKYSDDKIKEMLQIFNNETELGKLYINYPMVEAYYDLRNFPDKNFNDRCVELDGFNGKKYKKEVNMSTKLKKNNIRPIDLCYIIMHNYNKSKLITKSLDSLVDHNMILENQISKKNKENQIYVLSTLALLPIDYNYKKTIETIKLKLKDKYNKL